MSKLRWIGIAIAAGAAAHMGARAVRRRYGRGRRSPGEWLAERLGGLDDLAPGRLVHGQGGDAASGG